MKRPHSGPRRRQTSTRPKFPILQPFARRLESLRFERGLTQRNLAKRAGISANHYQAIAQAQRSPGVVVLLALAEALGVTVGELFENR